MATQSPAVKPQRPAQIAVALMVIDVRKHGLPTAQECMESANKLGVPEEWQATSLRLPCHFHFCNKISGGLHVGKNHGGRSGTEVVPACAVRQ